MPMQFHASRAAPGYVEELSYIGIESSERRRRAAGGGFSLQPSLADTADQTSLT